MTLFKRHKEQRAEEPKEDKLTIQDVLSGRFFSSPWFMQQRPFLYLILGIMLVFVYSSYTGNIQQIKLSTLLKEVREARYTMLDLSQEYNEVTRATSISHTLRELNSPVKEANEPPIRIK